MAARTIYLSALGNAGLGPNAVDWRPLPLVPPERSIVVSDAVRSRVDVFSKSGAAKDELAVSRGLRLRVSIEMKQMAYGASFVHWARSRQCPHPKGQAN